MSEQPIQFSFKEKISRIVERVRFPRELSIDLEAPIIDALKTQLDISNACVSGLQIVNITSPVDLRKKGRSSVSAVRLIRDLTSCSVRVNWQLQGCDDYDGRNLMSLTPPSGLIDSTVDLSQWVEKFKFGTFYWRSGPKFLIIRDNRYDEAVEYCLSEESLMQSFLEAQSELPREEVDSAVRRDLEGEGLVFTSGDWMVSIPYRMRHWPVPCHTL